MNFAFTRFMFGAFVHALFRWLGWKSKNKGRKLLHYWLEYTPVVIIVLFLDAVALFPLWNSGWINEAIADLINWAINFAYEYGKIDKVADFKVYPLPKKPYYDIAAGFVADFLGRLILGRFLRRIS